MLRTSLLFLSLLVLSACGFMHNAHPYNAIAPETLEGQMRGGFASTNDIFRAGTYAPDSLNTQIYDHAPQRVFLGSFPSTVRLGLGKGFSAGYDYSVVISDALHPRGYEQMFPELVMCTALKLHLAKSLNLGKDYHVSLSPGAYISQGVKGLSTKRHRMKYRHRGVELPLTFSKEFHKPINFVLSGTLRGAKDTFNGDISYPAPWAWGNFDFPNQPKNKVERYAAMVHTDILLSRNLGLVMQYGREYVKGKDRSLQNPILYLGFSFSDKATKILKPPIAE
ncbi:MAG: hypothetical protein LHW60_04775 [Candidatus Cloacimonetes bacterium]|nr:hypothetical protein [Candidatus Cloacimonadota bacterium]